jgi:xanthine dehydrogenase accessory factor
MNEFEILLAAQERGEAAQTVTLIAGPPQDKRHLGEMLLLFADGRREGSLLDEGFTAAATALVQQEKWAGPCVRTITYNQADYRVYWDMAGQARLKALILGGGHISQPLARFLAMLDFAVTVVDDRPEFANDARFPEVSQVLCGDFVSILAKQDIDGKTAVIIVTRGHRHDLECLRSVIEKPAGYIGMIGSRRKVRAIFDCLEIEAVAAEKIKAVRAPIGLDIGAQTPEEIALSIAAEIVAAFRGGSGTPLSGRGE